jgi:hypothetical protein
MKLLNVSHCIAAAFLASTCLPALAANIPITYSLTGTGTVVDGTDTTLTLSTTASGSILSTNPALNASWNPVSYSELCILDLNTNLLAGPFTLVFADGATLTGNDLEDDTVIDNSPTQTGPFSQTLTFTGGTQEFAGASGSVTGMGFLGAVDFTITGSGVLITAASSTPEPSSGPLLLAAGILLLASKLRRSVRRPN